MKIGLVGGSYLERSLPFDAQRSINYYPVLDQEGKEVSALYGTPGLSLFSTAGAGPIRNGFTASNDRTFVISGDKVYEINSAGSSIVRGSLDGNFGNVSIAENGFELAICDGTSVYIFTYLTNAFTKVTDIDLPSSGTITFIDGYFIVNKNNSGAFYISGLYDGLSWSALDFASAESSPDDLLRPFNAFGQLCLLGKLTGEFFTNTGASKFPFERIAGGKIEMGIYAPHTAVSVDNSIFWVGRDSIGAGIVYRANGFTPQRVSTHAIEQAIARATDPENMVAFSYQQDGHTFYFLTGGGLETSLVFDLTTGYWHERAYLNDDGILERHLASCCMFAFGKHLVGSRIDGKIYAMSHDYNDDNGREIVGERVFTHISDEGMPFTMNALEIGFESGVGTQNGQGENPVVSLSMSRDGARTWFSCGSVPIGAVGHYRQKIAFRRLGTARQATFKLRVTDPVRRAICGSYLH